MSKETDNTLEISEQFSDTLLVLNKEYKTVKAVKGIGPTGDLETVKANKANQSQFIRVDKSGDLFTNFFSNFFRQLKNPTKFSFFKVALPEATDVAANLEKHALKPNSQGEALVSKHAISEDLIKQLIENSQKQIDVLQQLGKNQEQQTNRIMEQKNENVEYRFKPEQIDWDKMAQYGITREKLEKNNQLDVLLKGFKTNDLITVSADMGSEIMRFDARLSLQQKADGEVVLAFHGIRKQPNLNIDFFGHQFTEEDKKNLQTTGNMGRVVELTNPKYNNEVFPSIISVDRLTNELVALKTEYIKIPDEIKGVKLSEDQKQELREGKALFLEGMTSAKGNEFSANVQFNADKRYVEFIFNNSNQQKQDNLQSKDQKEEIKEVPREFRGKELSDEQYNNLKNGETIYIDGLIDRKGKPYQGYINYNAKTGKTDFQFPNQMKERAQPIERDKTQTAVNSEGKTNEATKNIKEPLNTGQQRPKNKEQQDQQEKRNRSKGRKMS